MSVDLTITVVERVAVSGSSTVVVMVSEVTTVLVEVTTTVEVAGKRNMLNTAHEGWIRLAHMSMPPERHADSCCRTRVHQEAHR